MVVGEMNEIERSQTLANGANTFKSVNEHLICDKNE